MPDPETTLAMTAATTVVAAMATSAWQAAKSGITKLFHRHGTAAHEIEARLDRSAARVEDAAEPDVVRAAQITRWREDIEDLVRDHPQVEDELRRLVSEIQPRLPPVRQQWVQRIEARDGGIAAGAQGPNSRVVIHPDTSSAQGTS